MNTKEIVSALTIAGSDSGGGAGIQADLKTFAAHGVHGLSAIAALTAQHTRGVVGVHLPPVDFLRAQIDACFDDFSIGAVKTGMLADGMIIAAVVDALLLYTRVQGQLPVVVDPVMVATSGATLLEAGAVAAMRMHLLPLATVLTPNLPEAEILLNRRIQSLQAMHKAAHDLLGMGPRAVLLKGGHLQATGDIVDVYVDVHGHAQEFTHARMELQAHGTGCTLASAIAANLCLRHSPQDACRAATDYVHAALVRGYRPGRSDVVMLDHFGAAPAK